MSVLARVAWSLRVFVVSRAAIFGPTQHKQLSDYILPSSLSSCNSFSIERGVFFLCLSYLLQLVVFWAHRWNERDVPETIGMQRLQ